jgi:hypothetical protein
VTHVGTIYKTASPRFYLDALDGMPEAIRGSIETRFVGRIAESEREIVENRLSPVKALGFMPQAEALKNMEETDYLLLTMTNDISVPGKLFEYMASGKPILAIAAADSEVGRILHTSKAGLCATPDSPIAIQAMIMRAWEARRDGKPLVFTDINAVRQYERPQLARQYARIIRELEPCGG